jgi:hypothetical protein
MQKPEITKKTITVAWPLNKLLTTPRTTKPNGPVLHASGMGKNPTCPNTTHVASMKRQWSSPLTRCAL